jgi:hypothetical protein
MLRLGYREGTAVDYLQICVHFCFIFTAANFNAFEFSLRRNASCLVCNGSDDVGRAAADAFRLQVR